MEYKTEFNLVGSIREYIKTLNASNILKVEDADEVFDHWMTESDALIKSGLNAREAFEIVKMRFGQIAEIENEYFKSNPAHLLSQYFLGGVLLYTIVRVSILTSHLLFRALVSGNLSPFQVDMIFFGKPILFICLALSAMYFVRKKLLSGKISIVRLVVPLIILLVGLEYIECFHGIYFFSQIENFRPLSITFLLGSGSKFPMLLTSIGLLVITFFASMRGNKNLSIHLAVE